MTARPFRFGVTAPSVAAGPAWAEKARRAEQLGYSVLGVPDHFREQLAPVPALAAAALATTRLRVASLVFCNDFRHPVVLAKEAATLDLLSEGRFELGLGAGWLRLEYDQAGIPFEPAGTRIERLAEAVTIVKGLLAGERVTFSGRHYTIADLEGRPAPVQRPHPPVLIGGGGRRTLSLAAREASIVGLVPRALPDGSGLDRSDFGADALRQKIEWVRAAAGARFDSLELHALIQAVAVSDQRTPTADALAARFRVSRDLALESPYVLLGTIDEICETVRRRREQYGISYLTVFERDMEAFAPVVARLAGT
ncbi:MAG TPA: TIGR03621 family F420-dependent LLM class oxidoreductase [Methylomirabilota bacterium]|nr:TIGR03621 family F420-dependent LLM class oxidoreductase [Methylomirabilota bacterium]